MGKWKYEVRSLPPDINGVKSALKTIGSQGWEIISIVYQPNLRVNGSTEPQSDYFAYLKKGEG
jgi:hypothetical protein